MTVMRARAAEPISTEATNPNGTSFQSTNMTSSPGLNYTSTTPFPSSNHTIPHHHDGWMDATGPVVAIVVCLVIAVVVILIVFLFLKKIGKLPRIFMNNNKHRRRRSSTSSSRRALDEESCADESIHRPNEKLKQTTEEMFTIDDFEEEDAGGRERDEYFYDEVFGQSEFEDETTKNAVRQLYNSSDGDTSPNNNGEEMLDFDFETLGIKSDEYSLEASRKRAV